MFTLTFAILLFMFIPFLYLILYFYVEREINYDYDNIYYKAVCTKNNIPKTTSNLVSYDMFRLRKIEAKIRKQQDEEINIDIEDVDFLIDLAWQAIAVDQKRAGEFSA